MDKNKTLCESYEYDGFYYRIYVKNDFVYAHTIYIKDLVQRNEARKDYRLRAAAQKYKEEHPDWNKQ